MRLFIAVQVPARHRTSLEEALGPLRKRLPDARWTDASSWHVTVKFLGEVPETQLDEVQEVMEEAASKVHAFPARLTEPGAFPSLKRPRVLWMGLGDEGHHFRSLAGRMERKFESLSFSRERRSFRPHLTLARFRQSANASRESRPGGDAAALRSFLEDLSARALDRSPFQVGEVVLFQSHLSPAGSVYDARLKVPLQQPD